VASATHPAQHGDDAREKELALGRVVGGRRVEELKDVDDRSALERRAARNGMKTCTIGPSGLARGLSASLNDGCVLVVVHVLDPACSA
jgi:hypothetical protein